MSQQRSLLSFFQPKRTQPPATTPQQQQQQQPPAKRPHREEEEKKKKEEDEVSSSLAPDAVAKLLEGITDDAFSEDSPMSLPPQQEQQPPPPQPPPKPAEAKKKFADGFFNTARRKELHRTVVAGARDDKYSFLRDVRDGAGRRAGDAGFDPTTLLVPQSCLAKMTAFERQFWEVKAAHYDTLVFFRKGKFYELYADDADVGQRELGLRIAARQDMRMVGVPAPALMDWAAKLLARGYKVARVDEMSAAVPGSGTIIKRDLTRIFTPATLVEEPLIGSPDAVYLLAFVEHENAGLVADAAVAARFAVCLADAGSGEFLLGEFDDDKNRTAFETLLAQKRPREILVVANSSPSDAASLGCPSQTTLNLIRGVVPSADVLRRKVGDQFWDAAKTAATLDASKYWGDPRPDCAHWPPALLEAKQRHPLALSCVGACVQYLQELKIDGQLLSLRNFRPYSHLDDADHMALDGQTLRNLEILRNSMDGIEGTLLSTLDHIKTSFGRRLFTRWLCAPLRDVGKIEERLDAVEVLKDPMHEEAADAIRVALRELPDLERKISRINASAAAAVIPSMFFEVVCGFSSWEKALSSTIRPGLEGCKSPLLLRLVAESPAGDHPRLSPLLKEIGRSIDLNSSIAAKEIIPIRGYNALYDSRLDDVQKAFRKLDEFLVQARRCLCSDKVKWAEPHSSSLLAEKGGGGNDDEDDEESDAKKPGGSKTPKAKAKGKGKGKGKKGAASVGHLDDKRLLLEVPARVVASMEIPAEWEIEAENKQRTLFWTPVAEEVAPLLQEAEENIRLLERQLCTGLVERFCANSAAWSQAVSCMAQLDCLQCLATASATLEPPSCRPSFVAADPQRPVVLDIADMRHPCLCSKIENFVPNSLKLGDGTPAAMLLTGPNMGGKSTLLRQVGVLVVMAQLGCYVPASSFTLTPVDRIFTRIGASDSLVTGRSTFMVELQETASVLTHATRSSLAILDELGRGTATYDGYAIAYAVLRHVAEATGCRTLFSTHYHMLTREFEGRSDVVCLRHMGASSLPGTQEVVFTYQLLPGLCPRSHGLNVASSAGIPERVVQRAKAIADNFAQQSSLTRHEKLLEAAALVRGILSDARIAVSADAVRTLCANAEALLAAPAAEAAATS